MDIKVTCIECNRPNAVPYGRGHRICTICSQRELKRERRKKTQRRIQTLGGFVLVVMFTWMGVCDGSQLEHTKQRRPQSTSGDGRS